MPTTQSDLSREAYIQRHLLFNVLAFLTDSSGWCLGMSFFSAETILPYFVKALGGSDLLVGMIPSLTSLGFFIPQIFVAPIIERRSIQRKKVLFIAMFERFPFALIALFTFLFATSSPGALLWLFFLCLAINAFAMGINNSAYATMLTKSIPADKRGRFWGISISVGGIIGLAGAALSSWLLQDFGMPNGFGFCFFIGFVVLTLTVLPLGFVREPEALPTDHYYDFRSYWKETQGLLRRHPGFRMLVFSDWMFSASAMAPAFYTVYAAQRFNAGAGSVGWFTMVQIASATLGGFLWGGLSDWKGSRATLLITSVLMAITPLLAISMPTLAIYPAVFCFSALAKSGYDVGNFNLILDYAGESKVATFQGVRSLVVMGTRVLFPLFGGMLAERVGYPAVFLVSSFASVIALIMLIYVPDPRNSKRSQLDEARGDMTTGL